MVKPAKKSVSGLTFSTGCVGDSELIWILAQDDEVLDGGTEHTKCLRYKKEMWSHHILAWAGIAVCIRMKTRPEVLVIGQDGEWMSGTSAGFSEGEIDDSPDGPENIGPLRDASMINGAVFAVGMRRMAYKRSAEGGWRRIDHDLRAAPGEILGLHGVCARAEDHVVAVGSEGEIWEFDGQSWRRLESDTNLDLHAVTFISEQQFVACGAAGILIRGGDDRVTVIDSGAVKDNFYGIAWFRKQLYVATLTAVYCLTERGLQEVDFGVGAGVTSGDLRTDGNLLCSIGAKHLLVTRDGRSWQQLFCT